METREFEYSLPSQICEFVPRRFGQVTLLPYRKKPIADHGDTEQYMLRRRESLFPPSGGFVVSDYRLALLSGG